MSSAQRRWAGAGAGAFVAALTVGLVRGTDEPPDGVPKIGPDSSVHRAISPTQRSSTVVTPGRRSAER